MSFFHKYFSLFTDNQKKSFVFLFFLLLGSTIFELLGISSIILFIDSILNIKTDNLNLISNFIINNSPFSEFGEINSILIFLILIFCIKFIFVTISNLFEANFIAEFEKNVSNKVFKNLIFRDYDKIIKENSSSHIRNLSTELKQLNIFNNGVIKIFIDSFLIIAIFIFLLYLNFKITLLAILFFSFTGFFYFSLVRSLLLKKGFNRQLYEGEKIKIISETINSIKTIKILSKEYFFIKNILNLNKKIFKVNSKVAFINSFPRNLFEILLVISFSLLFYFFFLAGYKLENILQILTIYFVASLRIVPSLTRIINMLQLIKFSYPAFIKILNEVNQKTSISNESKERLKFKKMLKIRIKNFSFDKKKILIKKAFIDIKKGQCIGIFGKSGSGKSTLLNIICGFLNSNHANILCDETSVKKNIKSWQSVIGYMPQDIPILNNTLKTNLLFGQNNNKVSNNYLLKILKKSNLKKFYSKKSKGLNQIINQKGLNISGGEIQRIGIARALLYNPEILIMDESTSALDTLTENKILDEIQKLKKTVIIVSHRLNTFKKCDLIFNLNDDGVLKKFKKMK